MPWSSSSLMSQRQQFLEALLTGQQSLRAVCAQFGISEKTGYKWRARFLAEGPSGLQDRSTAPHVPPHQPAPAIVAAVLALREAHPTWGSRKLKAVLERTQPQQGWPAASTITRLCQRAGLLMRARRRASATPRWATPALTMPTAPNDVWGVDFKGEFRVREGPYCFPLTVTDLHSRYLLACHALPSTASAPVQAQFTALFQRVGLPRVIRSDNGVPFAQPNALGQLSTLAVWWIRLGIRPERIAKGRPTQNGIHERLHKTLKAEATRPALATLAAQQQRFTQWQREYNTCRPHEALGQTPPAAHYVPSDRRWPRRLPILEYPPAFALRLVDPAGYIRFGGRSFHLSRTLTGETVGCAEVADGRWLVHFGPLQLGDLDMRDDAFTANLEWHPLG